MSGRSNNEDRVVGTWVDGVPTVPDWYWMREGPESSEHFASELWMEHVYGEMWISSSYLTHSMSVSDAMQLMRDVQFYSTPINGPGA